MQLAWMEVYFCRVSMGLQSESLILLGKFSAEISETYFQMGAIFKSCDPKIHEHPMISTHMSQDCNMFWGG